MLLSYLTIRLEKQCVVKGMKKKSCYYVIQIHISNIKINSLKNAFVFHLHDDHTWHKDLIDSTDSRIHVAICTGLLMTFSNTPSNILVS